MLSGTVGRSAGGSYGFEVRVTDSCVSPGPQSAVLPVTLLVLTVVCVDHCQGATAPAEHTICLSSCGEVPLGATATMTILLLRAGGAPPIAGAQGDLLFDDTNLAIPSTGASAPPMNHAAPAHTVTASNPSPGVLRWLLISFSGATIDPNGGLVELEIQPIGATGFYPLTHTGVPLSDPAAQPIPVTAMDGQIEVY